MTRRQGKIERRTILALNKILAVVVGVRDQSSSEVIDASIASASAAIEELKQLYIADVQERRVMLEATGFDFDKAEDPN